MRDLGCSDKDSADSMPIKPAKGQQKRRLTGIQQGPATEHALTASWYLGRNFWDPLNPMVAVLSGDGGRDMESENDKPDAAESKAWRTEGARPKSSAPNAVNPQTRSPDISGPEIREDGPAFEARSDSARPKHDD